eukprot:m.272727 g.272727  ORF g.272727 m.272727 type:complete len:550 (-) comp54804_c0_seq1:172-1821(-)
MGCCSPKCKLITFGILAIVFFVLGGILKTVLFMIMHQVINKKEPLTSPSSEMYSTWSNPSVQTYEQYYFWNLTNPDAVLNGSKPSMELVGPFSYDYDSPKYNISWSDDENVVAFYYNETYTYIPSPCQEALTQEKCSFPDDTMITTINVPLMGVINQLMSLDRKGNLTVIEGLIFKLLVDELNSLDGNQDTFFIRRPVRELLWGYTDPLLEFLHDVLEEAHVVPNPIPSAVFSLASNGSATTTDAPTVQYTGKDTLSQLLSYILWGGQPQLPYWNGCTGPNADLYNRLGNMINGTDATMFAPGVTEDHVLSIFSDSLVRSATLVFAEDTSIYDIDLLRFQLPSSVFANAEENPANCAFSMFGPSGVFNMTSRVGAPIFASVPYFYQADPYYTSLVDGLDNPDPETVLTFVDVEPWTGAVMYGHQRVQLNLRVEQFANISWLAGLQESGFYFPLLYIDENAMITESLANDWKSDIGIALKVARYGPYAAYGLGGLFSLLFFVLCISMYRDRNTVKYSPDEVESLLPPSDYSRGGQKKPRRPVNESEDDYA